MSFFPPHFQAKIETYPACRISCVIIHDSLKVSNSAGVALRKEFRISQRIAIPQSLRGEATHFPFGTISGIEAFIELNKAISSDVL